MSDFAQQLIAWHAQHGRHDLPWQQTRDPYRIWVSEIMLQQTQVATVIPYYARFMQAFPDVQALAQATLDKVLAHWSGLGYYSRARNLHAAAQHILHHHRGRFPTDVAALQSLPGIGRSTAAAIAVFAFGAQAAILDGNVKRLLARHFGVHGYPGHKAVEAKLWALAEAVLPEQDLQIYTQALMDFGATLCTRGRVRCPACPLQTTCAAYKNNWTHILPTSKPRVALPERETVMLLLQHEGKILLEKRPTRGIWGGLWSFPEVAKQTILDQHLRAHFGTHALATAALPSLRHSFTHFHLRIEALHVQLAQAAVTKNSQWWTPERAQKMGLPAPVRRLLNALPQCA